MNLKEEMFRMANDRSFENSKPMSFTYCEINEPYVRMPKIVYFPYYVWTPRGPIPDSITEGEEILAPYLEKGFLEDNLDEIFEEIKRMEQQSERPYMRSYLYLYYNHAVDKYALVFWARTRKTQD